MNDEIFQTDDYARLTEARGQSTPTDEQRAAGAGWDTLLAREFAPRPLFRVPAHPVGRARYPVIDVHKHLGYSRNRGWPGDVDHLLEQMDRLNIQAFVNLDGFSGDYLRRVLDRYAGPEDRFRTFAGAAWHRSEEPDFVEREARDLRASVAAGARGFKVFKALGLGLRDAVGALWMPDDERLTPIWDTAADLGVPVLIHVADPEGFFRTPDRHNDRWRGLANRPEWYFGAAGFPPFQELIDAQVRLFQRHRRTTFFGAHVMNRPEDLAWVGGVLDACPNVYAEISARINDLGRQPHTARAFLERYAGRVLFGTDGAGFQHPEYFRVLETEDDLIVGPSGTVPAGTWPLYGLGLSDAALRALYQDTAARILNLS
jgi:predicted TIM-barrel fold metal-dependent hydrolase